MLTEFENWKKIPSNGVFFDDSIEFSNSKDQYGTLKIDFDFEFNAKKHSLHSEFIVSKSTGAIYGKMSPDSIKKVFWGLVFVRPLQIIFKMTYHALLPISIPLEIKRALDQSGKPSSCLELAIRCTLAAIRSFADILRTPLYGIALTVIALAAVLFSGNQTEDVYSFLNFSSRVERDLFWGEKKRCLARCQQPIDYLHLVSGRQVDYDAKYDIKIEYNAKPLELRYGLIQMSVSYALFQKKLDEMNLSQFCAFQFKRFACG